MNSYLIAYPFFPPPKKIFYDLRLDLRFVWYNGCELSDIQ